LLFANQKKSEKNALAPPQTPAAHLPGCMPANRFARAARPLGRSLAAFNTNPCLTGRQRFTTSALRRSATGSGPGPRSAPAWSLSTVFAAAAAAGLLGWGASELRHQGFPGAVQLDGTFPARRYASMREMEQVCLP
jgi:D-lactate dehydrogenase (cytochrome)